MIRVVGANPAMDRVEVLDRFELDEVNRSVEMHVIPGGKGLNVARGIRRLGADVAAYGFAGGFVGRFLRESCKALGIRERHTPIEGETRICTILVERERGRSTVLNEPGPWISPAEQAELVAALASDCERGDLVVLSGSLPPGVPDDFYSTLIARIEAAGAHAVVDTAGIPLARSMRCGPWIVKVNIQEFGQAVDMDFDPSSTGRILAAMREQVGRGSTVVIVTRRAAGLLAVTPDAAWEVAVPNVHALNPTGSGDLMLSGLVTVIARGGDLEQALVLGSACGVANAMNVTPELPLEVDLEALAAQVKVTRIG